MIELNREEDETKHKSILEKYNIVTLPEPPKSDPNGEDNNIYQ